MHLSFYKIGLPDFLTIGVTDHTDSDLRDFRGYAVRSFKLATEMINTVEALSNLLQGSFLERHAIRQFAIDESDEFAFAIEVPRSHGLDAWHLMRSYLKDTQRYPLLVEGWGADDYFARFYYEEEVNDGKLQGISPKEILATASTADLEAFLETKKDARKEYLEDSIEGSLARTRERFGASPDNFQIKALIDQQMIRSTVELEKWLFNWELQNFSHVNAATALYTSYLDWFEPDSRTATLLLLPVENGWDSLAYIHWFGACSAGTPVAIGFLKQWHQHYDAELVCHYGTMLQLNVGRLPETPEEAFELAWQQEALAECTTMLPGITLRDHARSLLMMKRWFLHERP